MMYAFAAMMGMCGTLWPGWWKGPKKPQPDPWWLVWMGLGAAGGLVATIVFEPVLAGEGRLLFAATAFFGGVALANLVGGLTGIDGRIGGGPG